MKTFNAIGIDVGGTKIAGGWVSFPGARIRSCQIIPTAPERGGAAVLDDVVRLATGLAASARAAQTAIDGIGLGLCELVSPSGAILSANCVEWLDQPVATRLSALAPTCLEADVRAAARAEALFGAGREFKLFLYVTVGTGIASSLVIQGEPFVGAHGATGTMASSPLSLTCDRCGHINCYTLEELAAGPGLVQQLNRKRPRAAASGHEVLAAAAGGDLDALSVVNTGAEALESVLGLLINVLDPEAVIVGGGLGLSEGPFWDSLITSIRRHIWSDIQRDLPILRAATHQNAGLLGAAATAWKKAIR